MRERPERRSVTAAGGPIASAESEWLAEVGMRIRLARVRRRLSQNGLADLAGVSRVTVGSMERGDHAAGVLAYVRLAHKLELPIGELLDGAP